jgi:hypothetical protein
MLRMWIKKFSKTSENNLQGKQESKFTLVLHFVQVPSRENSSKGSQANATPLFFTVIEISQILSNSKLLLMHKTKTCNSMTFYLENKQWNIVFAYLHIAHSFFFSALFSESLLFFKMYIWGKKN